MLKYLMGTGIAKQCEDAVTSIKNKQKAESQRDDSISALSHNNLASRRREIVEKRRRNASTCQGHKAADPDFGKAVP